MLLRSPGSLPKRSPIISECSKTMQQVTEQDSVNDGHYADRPRHEPEAVTRYQHEWDLYIQRKAARTCLKKRDAFFRRFPLTAHAKAPSRCLRSKQYRAVSIPPGPSVVPHPLGNHVIKPLTASPKTHPAISASSDCHIWHKSKNFTDKKRLESCLNEGYPVYQRKQSADFEISMPDEGPRTPALLDTHLRES